MQVKLKLAANDTDHSADQNGSSLTVNVTANVTAAGYIVRMCSAVYASRLCVH